MTLMIQIVSQRDGADVPRVVQPVRHAVAVYFMAERGIPVTVGAALPEPAACIADEVVLKDVRPGAEGVPVRA